MSLDTEINESQSNGYMVIYKHALLLLNSNAYPELFSELLLHLQNSDNRSLRILAQDLLPDLYADKPDVAIKLVHLTLDNAMEVYAAQNSLSIDEVKQIRTSRVKSNANRTRSSANAILESQNKIPYTENEILFAINLVNRVCCQWKKGAIKGMPHWRMIATVMNAAFGNNRTPQAIAELIKRLRENNDCRLVEYSRANYSQLVESSSFYMDEFILNIILEKDLYLLHGPRILEIVTNPKDLRSYREIAQEIMPEEFEISERAAEQIMVTIISLLKADKTITFDYDLFEARNYLIHGNRSRTISSVDSLMENVIRYSRDEIIAIVNAMRNPAKWVTANGKVKTDYAVVERIINDCFHGGEKIRSADNISNIVRWYRSKRKKMMQKFSMYVDTNPEYFPDIDDLNTTPEAICDFYFSNIESFLITDKEEYVEA